jgi:hypothetical protein
MHDVPDDQIGRGAAGHPNAERIASNQYTDSDAIITLCRQHANVPISEIQFFCADILEATIIIQRTHKNDRVRHVRHFQQVSDAVGHDAIAFR